MLVFYFCFFVFFFFFLFVSFVFFFFFFQAEDGIRDKLVTGVQTCALPILPRRRLPVRRRPRADRLRPGNRRPVHHRHGTSDRRPDLLPCRDPPGGALRRSEERRVGKECRSRWSRYP